MITHLNEIGITNQMITSLFITILLGVLAFLATRNMKLIPSGLQNFAEWAVETMQNFFAGVMGERLIRKYLPFIATFFIYIINFLLLFYKVLIYLLFVRKLCNLLNLM